MKPVLYVTMLSLALTSGCEKDEPEVSAALQSLGSCQEVEASIRQTAINLMNTQIDQNLESALKTLGEPCDGSPGSEYDSSYSRGGVAPTASGQSSNESGAKQVSGTNNQVAGVDEADFVKNDNKYIYLVSGGYFRIIQAWPADQTKELVKVAIDGQARKLFISNERALIYSSLNNLQNGKTTYPSYGSKECTYGYACSFTGDGYPTLITVLDLSVLTQPKKVRELKLSGSYLNARKVGNAVFTVLSSPGVSFKGLTYWPKGLSTCNSTMSFWQVLRAFDELRNENIRLIQQTTISDWLPSVEDTQYLSGQPQKTNSLLTGCKGFYKTAIGDGSQFTTLLGLDMTKEAPVSFSSIVSRPGAVYASAEALYMAVPHAYVSGQGWYSGMSGVDQASTVHKFALDTTAAKVAYAASGVVKGKVLNQFAMDEHNKYLRIATSNGQVPSPNVHSTLSVLRHAGASLVLAGQVDNLAPKEDIRSVRFDGERGFMVTFKKTDPLFVFDLGNPNQPQVKAELKIPGFSTYMHMMDSDHLLTIGYDASEQGSFAYFTGVMLQIFDVKDMKNPKQIHKEVIGTRGSSSEALNNHLAFTFFPPKKALALPMTICEGGTGSGSYGQQMTFSGLMVYTTTVDNGFKLRGKVDHPAGSGVTCSNWWTNANSQVKRSIIMDDYVYSISGSLLKVNHLDTLSTDLVSLKIDN